MEPHAQLDSACGTPARALIAVAILCLFLPSRACAQTPISAAEKIARVKKLYDAARWNDVVNAVPESPAETVELELYRGLALAQLQRFREAEQAFRAGLKRSPRDARFFEELAGIAYRQKQFARAKTNLRRALVLAPKDDYANNFIASIYFLEGNLDAALKYWNR